MILPHPESDLTLNIMVLGVGIVEQLKEQDFVLVEKLMVEFLEKNKKRTPEMFLNSLTFLYSCGMIEKKGYKVKLTPRKEVQMKLNVKNEKC